MATNARHVRADPGFRWDSTTSDLAQQYYRRFKAGDTIPQRTYTNLPDAITSRLQDIGTTFDKLPGLLQRALVWDSGYVENGKSPNELVRVQTLNGVSMAEIAISLTAFQALSGCTAYTCTQPDGVLWYKNDKCSSTDLLKATHCLVDSFESGDDPHLAMWSTGGNDTAIPSMRLLKHKWCVGTSFYEVAAIHTAEEAMEPKYDECVVNSSDRTEKGVGSLVIACESLGSISAVMKANMTTPKRGDLVSAWLEQYAATGLDTRVPTRKLSSVPSASPLPYSPITEVVKADDDDLTTRAPVVLEAADDDTSIVVAISASGICVVLVIGLLIWYFRRRSISRSETNGSQAAPVGHYHRPIPTPHSPYPSSARSLGNSSINKGVHASVTRSTGSTESRSSTHAVDDMTVAYQAVIRKFLADSRISGKQIPYEQIELADQVSNGSYGEVWVGYRKHEIVAIKRLVRAKRQNQRDVEAFAQEIQLTARLHHPNVVRFIGVAWDRPEDLCMVMEFLPAGDLSKVLRESRGQLTWSRQKIRMARGLTSAVAYLHSQSPSIIHRDLKSKNVLLTSTLEPKVIDFGVSRRKMDNTMTAGVGTPFWTAPEVLQGVKYTEKSDIYSLGVLFTELDTCQTPYYDVPNDNGAMIHLKILNLVAAGKLRPSVTETCPEFVRDIVVRCMDQDPAARPTATEMLLMLA